MNDFHCEHPEHDPSVSRWVKAHSDQYVVTIDIMRSDGKERLARVGPSVAGESRQGHPGGLRMCRRCVGRLEDALRAGVAQLSLGEGYVAPEQGTLV